MSRLRRALGGLRVQLLTAHLVVVLVGVVVLLVGIRLATPEFLRQHMAIEQAGAMATTRMAPEMELAVSRAFTAATTDAILVAGVAALAVAFVVSALISERMLVPVRALASASRRIAAGHYAERVPVEQSDEIRDLAHTFNEMAASLEDGERRRRSLIADVAHELRTPVATLEGYAEGLLDGVVPASEETWARLHAEARRLKRLVSDLQEISAVEARQFSLHVTRVDPASISRTAVIRHQSDFAAAALTLAADIPAKVPAIDADPERVLQILANFLSNSLRYTPAGGLVTLAVESEDSIVRFRVTDSGIGISPEHLPHIFERFYRVDTSRSRADGGAGIGLAVAKALAEALGGRISAASAGPGRGSTFTLELPRSGPGGTVARES